MSDVDQHDSDPLVARSGFLSAFSVISPHFRPRRHRLRADAYHREMTSRFTTWNDVVGLPVAS